MPLLRLDVISKAYPSITNRIRAAIYNEASPLAIVASIIDTTAGHPSRVWTFFGLPRANYKFSLDEINGGGTPINNLALFDVSPGTVDGLLTRDDEQIQVGVTTGFDVNATGFTFDGTGGKKDYIGLEIVPSELTGRGILVRGLDYSWDKTTGTFTLLQAGDKFPNALYYNIHFDPFTSIAGNSTPTLRDFTIRLINVSTTLDAADFGEKLLVEPDADYMEVTLPDINTVPDGRALMVEVTGSGVKCAKFIPHAGDTLNFLRGNLFANTNETFSIYRYTRDAIAPAYEWRVSESDGNFKTVGRVVYEDFIQADVINEQQLDGSIISNLSHARLYNEVVLNLPVAQVCSFDDWATGNNKYLYSLANSADPSNANLFHVPDRRDKYVRNNKTGKSGDYQVNQIKETPIPIYDNGGGGTVPAFDYNSRNRGTTPLPGTAGNTETRPETVLQNQYVVL